MEFWFGFVIGAAAAVAAYEMKTPIVAWIQARAASLDAAFQAKVQAAIGVAPPAAPVPATGTVGTALPPKAS